MEVGRFEWERVIKKCSFKQQSTKLVALLLATYASEDGSSVRPGRERLSTVAGLSAKHVSTQLGKLEDLGLIFKIHNGSSYGRRGGLASVYQLTAPERLYQTYLDDPNEVEQVKLDLTFDFITQEQGNPSSPVPEPKTQEQGNSEAEHVNSESKQENSEAEHVNPSSPHQSFTPFKKHQPKNINHAFSVTKGNAGEIGLVGNPSIEDERSRQLAAMEDLIKAHGRKAS